MTSAGTARLVLSPPSAHSSELVRLPGGAASPCSTASSSSAGRIGCGTVTHVDWAARLHELGQRSTVARCAVLDVISSTPHHLSADEIGVAVSEQAPDVHRATVFRTLERLVALGLVAHVHLPHGATTYHLSIPAERMHLHLSCRSCGGVFDIDAELLDDVVADLRDQRGFELEPAHSALSGRCPACVAATADRGRVDRAPEPSDHS